MNWPVPAVGAMLGPMFKGLAHFVLLTTVMLQGAAPLGAAVAAATGHQDCSHDHVTSSGAGASVPDDHSCCGSAVPQSCCEVACVVPQGISARSTVTPKAPVVDTAFQEPAALASHTHAPPTRPPIW